MPFAYNIFLSNQILCNARFCNKCASLSVVCTTSYNASIHNCSLLIFVKISKLLKCKLGGLASYILQKKFIHGLDEVDKFYVSTVCRLCKCAIITMHAFIICTKSFANQGRHSNELIGETIITL